MQAVAGGSQSVASDPIPVTTPVTPEAAISAAEPAPLAAITPNSNGNGNGSLAVSRMS